MTRDYGEAFETFYRQELSVREGPPVQLALKLELKALADKELLERISEEESFLEEKSKKLAEGLNYLSNKKWESSVNVYLRLIDSESQDLTVFSFTRLMEKTRSFFRELYETEILERGESPELIDQIVKRTGSDSREKLERVLHQDDPKQQASKFIAASLQPEFEKRMELLQSLQLMSVSRLNEIRIFACALSAQYVVDSLLESEEEKEEISKKEEKKKLTSLRDYLRKSKVNPRGESTGRRRQILYALLGRSQSDISILRHYYDRREGEEGAFDEFVRQNSLSSSDEQLHEVLSSHIDWVAEQCSKVIEDERWRFSSVSFDLLESADRSIEVLGEDLYYAIPKRRVKRKNFHPYQMELESLGLLSNLLRSLSSKSLNTLFTKFSFEGLGKLHAEWFFRLRRGLFQKAHEFHSTMRAGRKPDELFFLLAYLSPWELRDLQEYFFYVSGLPMREALREYFEELEGGVEHSSSVSLGFLLSLLDSKFRYPASFDLLQSLVGEQIQMREREGSLLSAQSAALAIRGSLNEEGTDSEARKKQLLSVVGARPLEARKFIEYTYFRQSPHKRFLLADVEKVLGDDASELVQLLQGYDLEEVRKSSKDNLLELVRAFHFPVAAKKLLFERLEQDLGDDLGKQLAEVLKAASEPEKLQLFLCLAFFREALRCSNLLQKTLPLSDEEEDSLLEEFERVPDELILLERSYDLHFGSLRGDLKLAQRAKRLSSTTFAELAFRLEGIEPDLLFQIDEALESEDLTLLQALLAAHIEDIETINEVHKIVYEKSLRERIDMLDAPRDDINRCCLLTMGYGAESVANSLRDLVIAKGQAKLHSEIVNLLRPGTEEEPNSRIPIDPNWIDEMLDQVRKIYRSKYGPHFISELRMKSLDKADIDQICYLLYGKASSGIAAQIYKVFQKKYSEDDTLKALDALLKPLTPEMRRRVVDLYDDYFGSAENAFFFDVLKGYEETDLLDALRYLIYGKADA